MEPIAFQGTLTVEDYVLTDRLYSRTQPFQAQMVFVWGTILIIGIALALFHAVQDWQRWFTLLFVPGLPTVLFLRRATMVRDAWKTNRGSHPLAYQGRITGEGIDLTIGEIRVYTDWTFLHYYQATETLLLLYHSPYSVITLSRRFFARDTDWEQVRTLATQHLTPRFPNAWIDHHLRFQSVAAPLIAVLVVLMAIYI